MDLLNFSQSRRNGFTASVLGVTLMILAASLTFVPAQSAFAQTVSPQPSPQVTPQISPQVSPQVSPQSSPTADQQGFSNSNNGSGSSGGGGGGGGGSSVSGIGCLGSLLFSGGTSVLSDALAVPISNTTVENATQSVSVKQCILDGIAKTLAQQVLRQMTNSVINWIKTGFKGGPTFVTNPGAYFGNIADQALGQLITQGLGFACQPFKPALQIGLLAQNSRAYIPQGCSLTTIVKNYQGFLNGDFSQGGWNGWLALSTQDNPYSEYMDAQEQLYDQVNDQQNLATLQLNWGNGYQSIVGLNGSIITPGALINQEAGKVFGNDWDQLNLTKNFDDIFAAFVNTTINSLITKGALP